MSSQREEVGPEAEALAQALVGWYRDARRVLPWREEPTPYRVWISEIMLQQTQVATAQPYFERWMAAFPDVETLAAAPLEEVLGKWAGLGYYRRAHLLHAAAIEVVERHGGALPDTLEGLLALPGVGRYTAGAIASIAHNLPAPIVDGNVIRILSRIFAIEGDPRSTQAQRRLWALAEALIPPGQASDFNQAMMELGALVCSPRSPSCGQCPAAPWCVARQQGRQEALPFKAPRKARRAMYVATALVRDPATGRYLLGPRPNEGLWAGLWEFPSVVLERRPRVTEGHRASVAALEAHLGELGLGVDLGRPLTPVEHALTHIQLTLQPFEADAHSVPEVLWGGARWIAPEALLEQPLSAVVRRVVEDRILASEPNGRLL